MMQSSVQRDFYAVATNAASRSPVLPGSNLSLDLPFLCGPAISDGRDEKVDGVQSWTAICCKCRDDCFFEGHEVTSFQAGRQSW